MVVKDYSKALSLALCSGKQKAVLYVGRGKAYHLMGDHHKAFNDLNASLELLKENDCFRLKDDSIKLSMTITIWLKLPRKSSWIHR
ncbi:MAG: hypothetical protein IEMM0008_1357 [bacterium]|nr:MAG: hypothetical protein IEMM0008_1357 [bacterium]